MAAKFVKKQKKKARRGRCCVRTRRARRASDHYEVKKDGVEIGGCDERHILSDLKKGTEWRSSIRRRFVGDMIFGYNPAQT